MPHTLTHTQTQRVRGKLCEKIEAGIKIHGQQIVIITALLAQNEGILEEAEINIILQKQHDNTCKTTILICRKTPAQQACINCLSQTYRRSERLLLSKSKITKDEQIKTHK